MNEAMLDSRFWIERIAHFQFLQSNIQHCQEKHDEHTLAGHALRDANVI